jgi:hypothetical protein
MSIPFSDVSPDVIMMHLAKAAEHLTEVSNYAPVANIPNYAEVGEVSQLAFLLTLATKQLAEGDQKQAQATLKSVHSQLAQMVDDEP